MASVHKRYRAASRSRWARILDEFCVESGYNREYAIVERLEELRERLDPFTLSASVENQTEPIYELAPCACSGEPSSGGNRGGSSAGLHESRISTALPFPASST